MLTFLYTVSSSGAMPSSSEDIGGLVQDCLIGLGNAKILPSSPNHSFPYKGKQIIYCFLLDKGTTCKIIILVKNTE